MKSSTFIAGDWGTTQLRLFLCHGDSIIDTRSGHGVRALQRSPAEEFASLTRDWVEQHAVSRAILSGMVGSRNGWIEVPYVSCPVSIADLSRSRHEFVVGPLTIQIVPGLACTAPTGAPDVMRGEETQLLGALQLRSQLAHGRHVIALPGTHTKWVEIRDGCVERFQTAFTGELFALLKTHSTLLATNSPLVDAIDERSFAEAVSQRSSSLLHRLFEVRSRQLIEHISPAEAAGLLSGLLIGADVDGALELLRPDSVSIICDPTLARRYSQALAARNVEAASLDGDECVLAGLRALAVKDAA